jgi:hypothetical protein
MMREARNLAGQLIARFVSAAAIVVLVLGAMALPVAAASQTLVVDDNAVQCPGAAYTSIQDAIDDADPGDTVRVCAGHYVEQLTINKAIVVKATPLFAAHIDVPGTLAPVDGVVAAVHVGADDAVVQGFKLHIVAGGVVPNVRPSLLSCAHVDAAIYVQGLRDVVRYNRIDVTGPATLSGACGYDYGIVVGQHTIGTAVRPTGEALGSATARVTFNKIRDFKVGGILVEDEDSYAFVRRNAIKYLHLQDPGCLIFSGIPCGPVSARNTGLNGVFVGAFGIGVESGAEADIIRNAIRSGPNSNGDSLSIIVTTPELGTGIWLQNLDSGESNTVFHNAVWRVRDGIFTLGGAAGAVISYNHVTDSTTGLVAADTGDEWHHNHVENNVIGIRATFGGNNFHDNLAEDSSVYDCFDATDGGTGDAGTDNTWTNNIGALSSPDAICDPAASGT